MKRCSLIARTLRDHLCHGRWFASSALPRSSTIGEPCSPLQQSEQQATSEKDVTRWSQHHVEPRPTAARHDEIELARHSLISRRRIPANFVKDIFIPHLEKKIWVAKDCPPWYLIDLIIAYSQMPLQNPTLTMRLADMVIYRQVDFTGQEFAKMLFPLYRMRPSDLTLFAHLSIELEEHFLELTTLNLIAIVRVYARLAKNQQQIDFIERLVIPRLQTDMARYDTEELSALLASLSAAPKMSTAADVPLLASIIPQIEKRYDETPLLTSILNLNSLCRLRVFHKRLLDLLSRDLSNPWRVRNLRPKYIALAIWTFARYGLLERILPTFTDLIEDNVDKFDAKEFGRLCQAMPTESQTLLKLTIRLLEGLPKMTTNHFQFWLLGLTRVGFLPTQSGEEPIVSARRADESFDKEDSNGANSEGFFDLETPDLVDPEEIVSAVHHETSQRDHPFFHQWNKDHTGDSSTKLPEIPRETLLHECLQYLETFEDEFSPDEIYRLTRMLLLSERQQYAYITTLFPSSWEPLVNEVMTQGK